MDTTYQGFREYYARLADDDLRQVAVTASDLVEDGQRALTEELATRGITNADTTAYKAEMQAHAAAHQEYLKQRRAGVERGHRIWRRFTVIVFAFPFLFGAWRFMNHERDGITIMVICAIALPVALLYGYVKKRMLLALLTK